MTRLIDAHVHFGSLPFKGKNWGSFAEYKQVAKNAGVSSYCVTPIGLPENFTDKTTPDNNSVLIEAKKNKAVIPVYWFNVFDLPTKLDSAYRAIKFHPDIGQINLDDTRVIEFVNLVGKPVFVHTNEAKEYSSLLKASNLARKVDVPVIAVHSGSVTKTFFNLDNYKFPQNVYFETSGIQYALILKKIYENYGAERIVFGSDYPFGDPRVALAMIDTLNPSKSELEKISGGNILKILGLK